MNDVVILHFSPLELYPPVQNLLNSLVKVEKSVKATVISTRSTVYTLKDIYHNADKINIIRLSHSGKNIGIIKRYWAYFLFNTVSLIYLLIKRPRSILYYETISSYPAYFYKRYFNSKARVFIHFHEYSSPEEYVSGMRLNRLFFDREKWLYSRADWVSHTNDSRMEQFLKDIQPVKITNPHTLPNYPPKSWSRPSKTNNEIPIRAVYVGALSLDTMFLKEFTGWLILQQGKITLDIYSFNIAETAKEYLNTIETDWIKLMDGVNYSDLPEILKDYSLGIVLYKGHIPNYIYNAPNKLFEYMVCGLDVWFPDLMKGSLQYSTSGTYPKAIAINFLKMRDLQLCNLIEHTNCVYKPLSFNCEDIYAPFIKKILGDD